MIVNKGPNIVKLKLKLSPRNQISNFGKGPPTLINLEQRKGQVKVRSFSVEVQLRVR